MKSRTFLVVTLWLAVAVVVTAQDDSTDKSPHKSAFITVNGVRLHYLDWGGAGETLLFLHGQGDTAHRYDDFAPRFTNQFRVLGLTRRGHGESEIAETGYDAATLVEDVRQFLDALRIQRAVLAGHSFAGDELTRFAGMYPDRVIKLIYFDSAFDHSRVPESLRFKPLHGWSPGWLPTQEESESPDGRRRWVNRYFEEHRSRAMYSMMEGTYSEKHEYGKIKAPALAFFAIGYQKDVDRAETLSKPQRQEVLEFLKTQRRYHEQEIEHFRREISNGRVIVFTNAPHQFPFDREDEVLREVREFLSDAGSRAFDFPGVFAYETSVSFSSIWAAVRARNILPLLRLADTPQGQAAAAKLKACGEKALLPTIKILQTGETRDKVHAAHALILLDNRAAVEPLIGALSDSDATVRSAVCGTLGYLRDSRAVPSLIALLRDPSMEVVSSAASALGWIGDRRAVAPLLNLLNADDWKKRSAAVSALGQIGDFDALPSVRTLLCDPSGRVRKDVKFALARFHQKAHPKSKV